MTHTVSNLRFVNAEQSAIDCTLALGGQLLPFTASADDPDERGQEIYFAAVLGSYGEIAPFVAATPPEPTPDDVTAERARRLALGFDHDFGDSRGVHRIGMTAADQEGWDEVTTIALARKAAGVATPIGIVTDTGACAVSPDEWLQILEAAAGFRQPIWAASFALQGAGSIPDDFAADAHWP